MTKKNKNNLQAKTEQIAENDLQLEEVQRQQKEIAKKRGLTNQPYSELNNFIQYSMGDNVQAFIDMDKNGNPIYRNGIVKYNYNKNDKPLKNKPTAEIVILDAFTTSEADKTKEKIENAQEIQSNIETELKNIYKPISQIKEIEAHDNAKTMKPTSFKILLKKVELFFVEQLYNNSQIHFNPTITIKDTELAKIFNMDRANINREMNKILIALSQIQIRSFKWAKPMYSKKNGKKEQIPNLALVNLIQDAVHVNGVTQITFNDKFTEYISLCNVVQNPKELYQVKDALTFDLILYLFGQVREKNSKKFKIKVRTIYDTIKQIPRYEDVKDRHYSREIYQPLRDAMDYLGKGKEDKKTHKFIKGLNIANIEYENTDFINSKEQYDFNKWLDTNLVIEIIKEPNYQELRDARAKHRKLAEKNK